MYKSTTRSFGGQNRRAQFGRNRRGNSSRPRQQSRGKQYIHPDKFINRNVIDTQTEVAYEPKNLFTDFGFDKSLESNLANAGFTAPSAIQDHTIPFVMNGRDVIGLANTGTGKTAAFILPIINRLQESRAQNSVLIMAPTRELAQQIDAEFKKFSTNMRLYSAVLVGGVNINSQFRALKRNPHVIIGTPGRLKDHITRGTMRLDSVSTLVLDEADRMLDMGFVNDIRAIVSQLSDERQTLCFSATLDKGVGDIINDFMKNPEMVSVKISETNDHIYQDIIHFHDNDHKKEVLFELLAKEEFEKVIVFGETKFGVQRLSDTLSKQGISSNAIHGNKSQSQRMRALEAFKSNKSRVLVATDVAARGLDIPNVSHVINFDQPTTYDDYVHRIGRTGRGGKSGVALTFVAK